MKHTIKAGITSLFASLFFLLNMSVEIQAMECEHRFVSTGNSFSGDTYKTFVDLPEVGADRAFQSVYQFVMKEGWQIQEANAASGTLVAHNNGTGKAVLSVSTESAHRGVKIAIIYSTPIGIRSPKDAVMDQFCRIVAATTVVQRSGANISSRSTALSDRPQLCVATACLGMTLKQASTLDIEAAGTSKFSFGKSSGGAYGLGANGQRVWFSSVGEFDKLLIAEFSQRVRTVCSANYVSAILKASDGQPVRLLFQPTIRNGRGSLILAQIDRQLPDNMSVSELSTIEKQARERYGTAFRPDTNQEVSKPSAMVHYGLATGRSLRLILPVENLGDKLLEQPGCTEPGRLD